MTVLDFDCARVEVQLHRLLDGALSGVQAEAVNAHFRACPRCARFYSALRRNLVSHRWARAFDLDLVDACVPDDIPDYARLAERLRGADLGTIGALLYEILKAEFLLDYGEDLEAREAPIADPDNERARGVEMVEDLRDWHDADELQGVDLRALRSRLSPTETRDRLDSLIHGMEVVKRLAPSQAHHATYYQGLAHYKARRMIEAQTAFEAVARGGPRSIARLAQVTLASLPVEWGEDPGRAIPLLCAALEGDALDALVYFNLAKAHFLEAGRRVIPACREALAAARALDPALVARQLARPSEAAMQEEQ